MNIIFHKSLSLVFKRKFVFIMSQKRHIPTTVDSRQMAADRKARTPMTVFVRGTDNVPSPVDLIERPGTYLDIELARQEG